MVEANNIVMVHNEMPSCSHQLIAYLLSKSLAELPFDALVGAFFGYVLHRKTSMHCDIKSFVYELALLGL